MPDIAIVPAYAIETETIAGPVTALRNGKILAQSSEAVLMRETRLGPTIYFPKKDLSVELIKQPDFRTFCPFKGTATYWDVVVGSEVHSKAAWSYENALLEGEPVGGMVCFSQNLLSEIEKGVIQEQLADPDDSRSALVDWMLRAAPFCSTPENLTEELATRFLDVGIAISRLSIMVWSLHPQTAGYGYVWRKERGQVSTFEASYENLLLPAYQNSPLKHVADGLGGVRVQLLENEREFSFPIFDELIAEGATDYVAMPLIFSNGTYNVMTLASDHPEGFTTANLGIIFECCGYLARLYEVFALRGNTQSLLETYLGKRTALRVLDGEIRRGDGDIVDAAVLFCDLRHSTRLETELGREDYLALLNAFLELTTETVNLSGGEVLKFIGDAILAIFPAGESPETAKLKAVEAAQLIQRGCPSISAGREPCASAIGLAFGEVTYGNIGSKERLDFTVIGAAANVAARLTDEGKTAKSGIALSGDFKDIAGLEPLSLGKRQLHNVIGETEVFMVEI